MARYSVRRVAEAVVPLVPRVHVRHGDAQHARRRRADHQRRPVRMPLGRAARHAARSRAPVELAVEVDLALAQQRADDRERLFEAAHPLVVGKAEGRVVGLVPARAQAQDQPAAADLVDRRGHLGQHRRRVEAGRSDERAELDLLGRLGQAGERGPDLPRADVAVGRRYSRWSPTQSESRPMPSAVCAMSRSSGQRTRPLDLGQLDANLEWSCHRPRVYRATTARASISTSARGSTSAATWTMVLAGNRSPK